MSLDATTRNLDAFSKSPPRTMSTSTAMDAASKDCCMRLSTLATKERVRSCCAASATLAIAKNFCQLSCSKAGKEDVS